jgi:hypothetical protein
MEYTRFYADIVDIVAGLMKLRRKVEAKSELVKFLAQYPKVSITRVMAIENYHLETSHEHLAAPRARREWRNDRFGSF